MKVALYLRVSTGEQTTMNQEIELKEYCTRFKHEIFEIYKDEGVSGTKSSRPELDRMLQDMRQRKFDAIVVWKFDRLGRSTAHLLQVLQELQNKEVGLIATSQNIDTNTPMGKFFFTILAGFAEMEREMIVERIKLGLSRRKKSGKSLGRQAGSKDKVKRKRDGYFSRWKQEGKAKWHKKQTTPTKIETKLEDNVSPK